MLMFIDGHVINLDRVNYVEPLRSPKDKPRMRVHFSSEDTLDLEYDFWKMEEYIGKIIQAPLGYSVVHAYSPAENESDGWAFVEHPVLAFRVHLKTDPAPITFEGEVDSGEYIVVAPNGCATHRFGTRYASVQVWKDWLISGVKPTDPVPEP